MPECSRMKKNILVLGRKGMLGSMVTQILSAENDFKVCATATDIHDKNYFDALHADEGLEVLRTEYGPFDYVVNCIAATGQAKEQAFAGLVRSIRVNALFPHELAAWASRHKVRGIQISSNAVFSIHGHSYDEEAPQGALDVYGKTKSLGEVQADHFLNLRCSIVGPSPFYRRGLMEWFLAHPHHADVNGFTNEYWNGVTTYQLAALIATIIREDHFDFLRRQSAVFHFAPYQPVSKYELLQMMAEVFGRKVTIVPARSSDNEIRRTLTTRYDRLKTIFPVPNSLKDELALLKPWFVR